MSGTDDELIARAREHEQNGLVPPAHRKVVVSLTERGPIQRELHTAWEGGHANLEAVRANLLRTYDVVSINELETQLMRQAVLDLYVRGAGRRERDGYLAKLAWLYGAERIEQLDDALVDEFFTSWTRTEGGGS